MVLDVLMSLTWIFGTMCLIWWIMKIPNYDFEELVELIMQVSELIEAFWALMLSEIFNIQWDWLLSQSILF